MMSTKTFRVLSRAIVPALLAGTAACAPNFGDTPDVKVRSVALKSDQNPMDESYYYQSAVDAIMKRDYASALDFLQSARGLDPHSARNLNAFGVVYDKLGRFDLSQRYYAEAQAADPQSTIVAQNLAYSKVLQGMEDGRETTTAMAASSAHEGARDRTADANPASTPAPADGTSVRKPNTPAVVASLDGTPFQFTELTPNALAWPSAPSAPPNAVAHRALAAAPPRAPQAPVKLASATQAPANTSIRPKQSATAVVASVDGTPLQFGAVPPKAVASPSAPSALSDAITPKAGEANSPASASPAPVAPRTPVAETASPARASNPAKPAASVTAAPVTESNSQASIPSALQAEVLAGADIAASVAKPVPHATPAVGEAPSQAPAKLPPPQSSMLTAPPQRSEVKVASATPSSSSLDGAMTLQPASGPPEESQNKPGKAPVQANPLALKPVSPPAARMAEPVTPAQTASMPRALVAHSAALPAKPVEPARPRQATASLVPAQKVQPQKAVLLTGHPLSIVNASAKTGADTPVRRNLAQRGWSLAAPHIGSVGNQAVTTLFYPQEDLAVARGLVRTLSIPVRLVANTCDCGGLELVIGANFPNRRFASLDPNELWPVELKFASNLGQTTVGEP